MFKKAIKEEVSEVMAEIEKEIKDTCRGLVNELFSEQGEEKLVFWRYSHGYVKTLRGEIKDQIISAAKSEFNKEFKVEAMNFIKGEEFLDSVVERIQKKQLNK
jgi:hypothetical protein